MEGQYTNLFLYSKFSAVCKKFSEEINSIPGLKDKFNKVCIDNKNIRDRISKEGPMKITYLPCVLRIYTDTGYVELFEGENAFNLLEKYKQEVLPEKEPEPEFENSFEIGRLASYPKVEDSTDRVVPSIGKRDQSKSLAEQIQKQREEQDRELSKSRPLPKGNEIVSI